MKDFNFQTTKSGVVGGQYKIYIDGEYIGEAEIKDFQSADKTVATAPETTLKLQFFQPTVTVDLGFEVPEVTPGEGYRLLEPDEPLMELDEVMLYKPSFSSSGPTWRRTWTPVRTNFGAQVLPNTYRRRCKFQEGEIVWVDPKHSGLGQTLFRVGADSNGNGICLRYAMSSNRYKKPFGTLHLDAKYLVPITESRQLAYKNRLDEIKELDDAIEKQLDRRNRIMLEMRNL